MLVKGGVCAFRILQPVAIYQISSQYRAVLATGSWQLATVFTGYLAADIA
jgi:hypothetical protein